MQISGEITGDVAGLIPPIAGKAFLRRVRRDIHSGIYLDCDRVRKDSPNEKTRSSAYRRRQAIVEKAQNTQRDVDRLIAHEAFIADLDPNGIEEH